MVMSGGGRRGSPQPPPLATARTHTRPHSSLPTPQLPPPSPPPPLATFLPARRRDEPPALTPQSQFHRRRTPHQRARPARRGVRRSRARPPTGPCGLLRGAWRAHTSLSRAETCRASLACTKVKGHTHSRRMQPRPAPAPARVLCACARVVADDRRCGAGDDSEVLLRTIESVATRSWRLCLPKSLCAVPVCAVRSRV